VNANRSDPNTFTTGGVAEFDGIADPTVALQGSGTARAPYLVLYLDATGRQNVAVQFDARDIDGSSDNSVQPIAVQYRIGDTGAWSNVPAGTTPVVPDASSGPSQANLVTAVDLTLPSDVNGQAQVQVRIITTDAVGSDEWIGIDNIVVSSGPLSDTTPPTLLSTNPADEASNVSTTSDIVLTFNENVQLGTGDIVITDGTGDTRTISVGGAPDPDGTVTVSGKTVTINPTADLGAGDGYHVTVANGAIQDTSGNSFAGIPAGGLDFTTAATQSFAIAATDASKPEGNVGTTPFTFMVTRVNPTGDATVDWSVTGTGGPNQANGADFSGPTSGTLTFSGAETSKTITLNVAGDSVVEPNETFAVTLSNPSTGATITTSSANGTIQNDDVSLTAIYTIQGSGHVSPLGGTTVTTQGVVIAVDTTSGGESSRGFYIQDPTGDGNTATSDAIFVFMPSGTLPAPGHLVQVTGTVQEFTPSGADPGSFSSTELSSVTNVTDLGAGLAITPVQIGGTGGLIPPTSDLVAGGLFYESLEDMLVTVKAPIAVGPTNNFGEIFTVVDNDNDPSNGIGGATGLTPHGNLLLTPGQVAFGDSDTVGGDFNPERVQIDADTGIGTAAGNMSGFVKPEVNVGAHLSDVTGVVTYNFANYQVLATQPYTVTQASPLVKETGTLTGDSNHLVIASYNAENIDPKVEDINKVQNHSSSNVDDDVGSGKFDTIANQIFNTLHAPDILAMQEIQDEDGAEISSDTSAAGTLQLLVGKINALAAAAGSPAHYSFVDNPFINNNADGTANGGQPGGNIRTAFIYRDDRVSLEPGSLKTLAADGTPISDQGSAAADAADNGDQVTNPDNPFFESRPPLIATFDFNGQKIIVVDNHFTSKGGSAALLGSDQPPFDAGEVTRAAQAQAVNNFVDSVLSANPNAKIVIAGDLNEFQFEEPLNVLKGTASVSNYNVPGSDPIDATATYTPGGTAVLTDLQDLLPPNERYDYVFEGNSETLDHMLVSNSLAAATQFDIVRLNAEFADQTSDHEPLTASVYVAPVVSGQHSFALPAGGVFSAPTGPAIIWDLAPRRPALTQP